MSGAEILVVDDEPSICDLLASILGQQGYAVRTVYRAGDALDILTQRSFDLILLDIKMPGVSGLELLNILRETYQDTPVIMVTAVNDANTAVDAMKKGAMDYILKPFSIDDVTSRVDDVLRKQQSSPGENHRPDRARLDWSRMEAIAQGVNAQVEHFDFHDRIVTERTIEAARQLNIPEDDINRWAAARRERLSAREKRMHLVNDK